MAEFVHAPLPPSATASRWRSEPFRIFFPLGVLCAWVGVGHWLTYATGISATYSCRFHGLVQMQAFMMAFAIGFLLTAIPRRTQTSPVTAIELGALVAGVAIVVVAALADIWIVSEIAYACLFLMLAQFALRRFIGRAVGRRPPAAFVLIPFAGFQGLAGAALLTASELGGASLWAGHLGTLFIEQGVFLCLAIGIGSLVLPLMGGSPPPADLGSSPRESKKAVAYAFAGATICASLIIEQLGFERAGPFLRAAVVTLGLGLGGGAWHRPGKTGVHRSLVWISAWLMPAGLVLSAILPDYRMPALHILFIGGFSLMAFGVATHVAMSHLNMEKLALGRPPAVIALGVAFALAMAARLAADASNTYFVHLGWASAMWIAGSAVWLIFLGPRLLRR